nr:hypothetical protein [candidate division Zixibacteria bacterium]
MLICFFISGAEEMTAKSSDYAYYEGGTYAYFFRAPSGWILDLDNAHLDGYTAAMYPDSQSYDYSDMIIYVWIFPKDSMAFQEFITRDSAHYIKTHEGLSFIANKPGINSDSLRFTTLETDDPGAIYDIVSITYFDLISEIVIYEAHIAERRFHTDIAEHLHQAINELRRITDSEE